MKTFFTIISTLFITIITAVYITGYISKNNRIAGESTQQQNQQEVKNSIVNTFKGEASSEDDDNEDEDIEDTKSSIVSNLNPVSNTTKATTSVKQPIVPTTGGNMLDVSLVAKHVSINDCWIIINSDVYSVASYISMHPGGDKAITNLCGKDATTAFVTRGGRSKHSSYAWSLLNQYRVGTLGQNI